MVIVHKERYLRGRSTAELDTLYRAGATAVGVHDVPAYESELEGLQALVEEAQSGDVVGLMCHAERRKADAWLRQQGGSTDDPDTVRRKAVAAAG